MEQLKALLSSDVSEIKEQVDEIKSQFYRLNRQEQEPSAEAETELKEAPAAEKAPVGEKPEGETPAAEAEKAPDVVDEVEKEFKELLAKYKAMRAEITAKKEQEMQQNLLRKENILEQMKALAGSETADVTDSLKHFRELQSEWKSIGPVPPQALSSLQKQYAQFQEQYYDLVKINHELREYDFKKNLEQKKSLIAAAEALKDKADVVEANRMLQKLHEEWAETGPVAREIREEIWAQFKEASTVINKRHQEYFEQLHAKEKENLEKKEQLIAQIRDLDLDSLTTNKLWEEATAKVTALQAEWRKIGFAPKKNNQIIYEEFRSYTNGFFNAKTAFYKGLRNGLADNLKQKRALVAEAEALKDSTEWRETTDKFVDLQKRWKEIGPVARKYSDEIWKQFTSACDHFFEQKKAARHADHEAYLQRKEERTRRHEKEEAAGADKRKLMRQYELLLNETKTMENNMGFFSGKAGALLDGMQKKIEANRKKMAELEAKINESDED